MAVVNLIALARATSALDPPCRLDLGSLRRPGRASADRSLLGQYRQPDRSAPCYDEGKRCAETLLFDQHRLTGLPDSVARIFNTYGPRMDVEDGRVVSGHFITRALRGRPITIHGDGSQTPQPAMSTISSRASSG